MAWFVNTLHDLARALLIGHGFWSLLVAVVLLVVLTLSGLTARVVVWTRAALLRT